MAGETSLLFRLASKVILLVPEQYVKSSQAAINSGDVLLQIDFFLIA